MPLLTLDVLLCPNRIKSGFILPSEIFNLLIEQLLTIFVN